MKPKLILFDLGSTLVYFQGSWDRVITEAIEHLGKTVISLGYPVNLDELCEQYATALRKYYIERDIDNIEYTTPTLLNQVLSTQFNLELDPDELVLALDAFYDHTGSHWKLDSEAISTLEQLKKDGYHLGLISNASYARDVYNQVNRTGLSSFFELILISAEIGLRKPHPAIFRKALEHFNVEPSQAMMVGDTLNADIIGSRRVGIQNIWIAMWASAPSTHYQDDVIVPDYTIQRLSQIPFLLKNLK
jgi:putative hydrolase of the HAD superfamily